MVFNIPTDKLKEVEKKVDEEVFLKDILMYIAIKQENTATEMIVRYIEENNNIKTTMDDIKSEIWFYQEGIYKPNGESKIQEITRKILGEAYTPQRVNKVVAKIKADTHIKIDDFFNASYLNEIPVKNGILNIITKKLTNFTPEKIFFNKIPIKYNKKAICPNVDMFFKSVLKEEGAAKVLEELFGYCLYKEHFIEKAVMFVGDGRNGKSKTISLLKSFLGIDSCCSVSLSQLNNQSTSVCELHGKLANLAGDLSPTSLKDTGLFKEVVGRDTIGAKRKYLRDLFFVNYSKQVFACNELPKVYDNSVGFWERWILFEFPFKFVDKEIYDNLDKKEKICTKIRDVDIILKITTDEELSGLLNKALSGLNRLLNKKKFSYNRAVEDVKDMWVRRSDSFLAFCMDYVEYDYGCITPKKTIRKLYSDYCKFHKLKGTSDIAIKTRLESEHGITDKTINLEQFGMEYREHIWDGLKLKTGVYFRKENEKVKIEQGEQGFLESTVKKNFKGFCENAYSPVQSVGSVDKSIQGLNYSLFLDDISKNLDNNLTKIDDFKQNCCKNKYLDEEFERFLTKAKNEGEILENPVGYIQILA
jgi:putative DNA primase/helicase